MTPLLLHCCSSLSSSVIELSAPRRRTTARLLSLNSGAPSTPPNNSTRFSNAVRLQLQAKQTSFVVFASNNTDPSGKDSLEKEASDGDQSGDAGQNPPFLTILAGFLVLILVFWIVGSFVMWFISIVTSSTSLK